MLTTQEVDQYIRLTLKQHGFADHCVMWFELSGRRLGQANPWEKRIELSPKVLSSFLLFRKVLTHEILHCIQFKRMGGTFQVNGRNRFHGKVWREVCKEYSFSPSTHI